MLTSKIANIKKKLFVFPIYKGLDIKMTAITKETYENNGIEVITDKIGKLWSNEEHI